jgi:Acetyltransferase (GNAT) domain
MPVERSAHFSADERFIVRVFRAGDEQQILDLFNRCFPHSPRTIEHFRWKYQRNPYGNERISLAFDGDGRLVGHYAGVPLKLTSGETVHHIGDTMTDPSVRHIGRGPTSILASVAQHFYDTFCEGKVAFNFGFNTANIQKLSVRYFRATRVAPVDYRVWPAPPKIARWQRWARGYQIEIVREPSDDFDALDPGFRIRRDARYLRWRYVDCPDAPYLFLALRRWRRLAGWAVLRMLGPRLLWVDGLGQTDILLRQAAEGRATECWGAANAHFEPRPEPQDLGVMCVPFAMADAPARMAAGFRYAMGNSDLV